MPDRFSFILYELTGTCRTAWHGLMFYPLHCACHNPLLRNGRGGGGGGGAAAGAGGGWGPENRAVCGD